MQTVTVWDLPVRVVHWSLVIILPAMWWTAEQHDIALHSFLGEVAMGLLLFRLLWGLFGSTTARFASFVRGPGGVFRYLRGQDRNPTGHNPLGAWSVVVLLLLLVMQIGLGLVAQDVDGLESGPLNFLVDYETADQAREWHGTVFNILLAFVGLHILAIAGYRIFARNDLITPMITGQRMIEATASAPTLAPIWKSACLAIVSGLAVVLVVQSGTLF